jgi:O-methyltransferase involved in polyketide biosynthesis
MDARAYRLAWPEGAVLYELDQPELLAKKEDVLQRVGLAPKCRRAASRFSIAFGSGCELWSQ